MTTSNSTDFTLTLSDVIALSLQLINVIGEGDDLQDFDYNRARLTLNSMLKAWEADDYHVWLKQTVTLFLQAHQNTYTLSSMTTDHATADTLIIRTLTVAAITSDTVLNVTSTAGCVANDKIGVKLDNGTIFWDTIAIVGATTITINNPLPSASAIDSNVYIYRNSLSTPFKIYSAVRRDNVSNIDIPLNYYSYNEYFEQPNKLSESTPVIWNYDRQITQGIIRVWPTPTNVDYRLNLIISRSIQDMDSAADTFDLPVEWLEAITYNLAMRLAPAYGKAQGDNFAEIRRQAMQYEQNLLGFDNEQGSIYIVPSYNGVRRA